MNVNVFTAIRHEDADEMTIRQLAALGVLAESAREWGTKELATHLGVCKSAVTRLCAKLGRLGYLTCRQPVGRGADGRMRIIKITADGSALVRALTKTPNREAA